MLSPLRFAGRGDRPLRGGGEVDGGSAARGGCMQRGRRGGPVDAQGSNTTGSRKTPSVCTKRPAR
jgi:hypothetical protein